MSIKNRLSELKEDLPDRCRLIAVSKTHPPETLLQAYEAGHRVFGENKVQELVPKYEALPKDIEWHMIGHLQSNKVKYIAPFIHLIHSVDTVKLLQEIDKQGAKVNRNMNCLLQVHVAKEETKFGFSPQELLDALKAGSFSEFANVRIQGIMAMASLTDDREQIRREFRGVKNLFDTISKIPLPNNFDWRELSMGMSSDYDIAIEEGSTYIRVGTAIFGHRDYTTSS